MILRETNVKSFKDKDRTVIKYYDDGGDMKLVSCPFCRWQGESESARLPSLQGHSVLRCPECTTILGAMLAQSVPQKVKLPRRHGVKKH